MQLVAEPAGAFAAFRGGDPGPLVAMLAENIVWHAEGRGSVAVALRGREAVFRFLAQRLSRRPEPPSPERGDRIQAFRLEAGRLAECWEWYWPLPDLLAEASGRTQAPAPSIAAPPCFELRQSSPDRPDHVELFHRALRRAKAERAAMQRLPARPIPAPAN